MNDYLKLFFARIVKDLKQKELLPLKLLFFMHSSTILVLYPYLTIHMRELGINVEETAIISAVTPAIAILMPPLAGMLADKIGNFRVMLSFFSVIGGCSALLLLLVPIGRINLTFPDRVVFGLSCSPHASPHLSIYQDHVCNPISKNTTFETYLQVESCGFACQAILNDNFTTAVMKTDSYNIQLYDIVSNSTLTYTYTLKDEDKYIPEDYSKFNNHQKLTNNVRYLTSIRKLSKHVFYFPAQGLYSFSCSLFSENNNNCVIGGKDQLYGFGNDLGNNWKAGLLFDLAKDDLLEDRQIYKINYIKHPNNDNIKCIQNTALDKKHISISIAMPDSGQNIKHLDLGSCSTKCLATSQRQEVCTNSKAVVELDMSLTFWSYLLIRVMVGIVSGTAFAMFEGAVIAILREHKADYGLQRIYATIGGMISSPISGWLIDFASRGKGYTDFRPIFFLYAALKIISGIYMLFINLEFKKSAQSVVADVIAVLKKVELIALFVSCLILGCAWGFIESFLFWLLEDLGGSKSLMGLTITVGGIVGIPLLVLSGPIVKKLGHANVIFIGFVFYAIRLLGYSLIYNPWLCLIFEAMESITFGLSFTAAVTYAAKLSTVTTDTTIQGMLGGLYYAVGKGIGSWVGGNLIKSIGIRHTFQTFSVVTIVTGIIYFAFYHLYMKHRPSSGTDITKKDIDTVNEKDIEKDLNNHTKSVENHADEEHVKHIDQPVSYEDALCNPAYENTEFDGSDENDTEKAKENGISANNQKPV